jgi:hypothetical protein
MDLEEKLKRSVGKAGRLSLKAGEDIPTVIKSFDDTHQLVTYINEAGIAKLKQAPNNPQDKKEIMEDPNNSNMIQVENITDFTS